MRRRARRSTTRAFTLIELMLVMGMMAILAAAAGMALAQAMEQGRVSRTQAQIARIHALLMTRYDSYRTRNIRLPNTLNEPASSRAAKRLWAIRETMRLEMPDRCHDIAHFAVDGGGNVTIFGPVIPQTGIVQPPLSGSYFRKVGGNVQFLQNRVNESSECLYLILSTIQEGDTNGLDFLLPSEIGDTDGDGALEILDAWGTPIYFLRWAPGLESPLQNQRDADPFDPLSVDPRAAVIDTVTGKRGTFALTPLVFSAGPDRTAGVIISKFEQNAAGVITDHPHNYSDPSHNFYNIANDPFCRPMVTSPVYPPDPVINPLPEKPQFGSIHIRDFSADNIASHFLSQK